MLNEPLVPRDAARQVLAAARVRAGPDAAPESVLPLAMRSLRETLGRWVGVDSFDSLVDRACLLANLRNPALPPLAWRPDGDHGPRNLIAPSGADWDPAEGGEVVIEALTELLARFVGDVLARQLILEGWDTPIAPTPHTNKDSE